MNQNQDDRARAEGSGRQEGRKESFWPWVGGGAIFLAVTAAVVLTIWPDSTSRIGDAAPGASLDVGTSEDARDVPVELAGNERSRGLRLAVASSTISPRGTWLYRLDGSITNNDSSFAVRRLKLKVELLDAAGKAIARDNVTLLDGSANPVGPGVGIKLDEREQGSKDVSSVRLSVEEIERVSLGLEAGRPSFTRDR